MQFPPVPGIPLPGGLQPQPFQMPGLPGLPSMPGLPPELTALQSLIQSMLQGQQTSRNQILGQVQSQIDAQEANRVANQPLLDSALANIQSVLSGQAASPGLQGLVSSAFGPMTVEGMAQLKQAAEEAAARRGMSLTDTPIGQPYLQSVQKFQENMGGQQAQALIGLRQQDAAFAQRIQEFQDSLRQQATTNRLGVLQSLGTPEQAASVLSQLGLGAQQAALQQYGIQGQQALGMGNLALQGALGGAGMNLQSGQLSLQQQAQGFQQQFAQQQAAVQNLLASIGLLGDPMSAFGSLGTTGLNLSNQGTSNLLNLSNSLLGQGLSFPSPGSTTNQTTTGGSGFGSTVSGLGAIGLGLGGLFGR